jgi:alpha-galactosidase
MFMEILDKFGYLPITEDSHLVEYIQWAYGLADHKDIYDFYQSYKAWSFAEETETRIEGSDEGAWQLIPIIEGILNDSGHTEHAVNLMNDGYIDNLPRDMVVEVPATVDKNGVHGVKLGTLPKGIAGLLNNQVAAIELAVEAALTGSREIALQALLVDPIVTSLRGAEKLLDDMLELQKPYLGYIL